MTGRSSVFLLLGLCLGMVCTGGHEVRAATLPTPSGSMDLILHTGDESSHLHMTPIPADEQTEQDLLVGTLAFDGGTLGVTGSSRKDHGRLILDILIGGGVMKPSHDHDAVGFAFLHADLDAVTLGGEAIEYRTIMKQNGQGSAPVFQRGILERDQPRP